MKEKYYNELIYKGLSSLAEGKPELARKYASIAKEIDRDRVEHYLVLGKAEFELMHYKEAVRWLKMAEFYGLDEEGESMLEIAKAFLEEEKKLTEKQNDFSTNIVNIYFCKKNCCNLKDCGDIGCCYDIVCCLDCLGGC